MVIIARMAKPQTPQKKDNLPRNGSVARRIYDCLERSKEGLTAFEIEGICGTIKNQMTHMNTLRDKQFIEVNGKRKENGLEMDVWVVRKESEPKPKKKRRLGFIPPQKLDPYECPACGKTIYWMLPGVGWKGDCFPIEKQRRLIVFDGPYTKTRYKDKETGEEKVCLLPKKPLTLFEEHTGQLIVGRETTEEERAYYAEHKKLRKPWTIGFEGHLKNCTGIKRWLNGKAEEKRRDQEVKWDSKKKRYGFFKPEKELKSMTEEPK